MLKKISSSHNILEIKKYLVLRTRFWWLVDAAKLFCIQAVKTLPLLEFSFTSDGLFWRDNMYVLIIYKGSSPNFASNVNN